MPNKFVLIISSSAVSLLYELLLDCDSAELLEPQDSVCGRSRSFVEEQRPIFFWFWWRRERWGGCGRVRVSGGGGEARLKEREGA